jgi:[acyl-carrier-protein] S-malonyltransferase
MKTAYLFPGQGSQHVGMGRALYEREPAARAVFDQADELLGFSISALCFHGPEEKLTDTVNQQPALFTTSLAAWAVLQERGDWPPADYVVGHSMGELSALAAAGSLAFADGLALVRRRGVLMKEAGERRSGAMAAILGLDTPVVEEACAAAGRQIGRPVQIANDNSPGQVVISGDRDALQAAMDLAAAAGARKVVLLPITIAAHSPLMASAAEAFARDVAATPVSAPNMPVIANLTAGPLQKPAEIRAELAGQLTGGVQWTASMRYLREQEVETFVEVGPGDVLDKLMKRIDRAAVRQRFTELD